MFGFVRVLSLYHLAYQAWEDEVHTMSEVEYTAIVVVGADADMGAVAWGDPRVCCVAAVGWDRGECCC